ncbi:MAG: thioredoxin-like domain-containing protein [Gemmataceae bacterium]
MVKLRHTIKLATLAILLSGTAALHAAPPEPSAMLAPQFNPKQAGVVITTPTGSELAACKIELVNGPGSASGWVLKDGQGRPVRKFVATKGAKSPIDLWCYYLDGQEVYREIDTASTGKDKPDQYRWFGVGGMRWGVDANRDGRIDGWRMISAEEVSQEVLKAIGTHDKYRFQALLISEPEIKSLELSAADSEKIKQQVAQAVPKFEQLLTQLGNVGDKVQWLHLEVQSPQCTPAETIGAKADLVHYKNAALLYENNGKHDWITVGEMVQVGRTWRLIAAPIAGNVETPGGGGGPDMPQTPEISEKNKPLIDELQVVDKAAPKQGETGSAVTLYNMKRAAVLEKLVNATTGKDRENWVKQMADSLSAALQNNPEEKAAALKLGILREAIAKDPANKDLAGYVAYREITADYSGKLQSSKAADIGTVQEAYREKLKSFVTAYPTAEDAPDALLNLGMISEFMGKETEAKNWYAKLKTDYAQHPLAAKASGALIRLGIEGQPFEIQGTVLTAPSYDKIGAMFGMQQVRGKVTVVYYWASWNGQCASDFNKLSRIMKEYALKGVELVTVSLDSTAPEAGIVIKGSQVPGTHLHTAGGLDSPLATQYGIMVLPQLFLVGKDGKVVSRTVQMSTLEDEVKKLTDAK